MEKFIGKQLLLTSNIGTTEALSSKGSHEFSRHYSVNLCHRQPISRKNSNNNNDCWLAQQVQQLFRHAINWIIHFIIVCINLLLLLPMIIITFIISISIINHLNQQTRLQRKICNCFNDITTTCYCQYQKPSGRDEPPSVLLRVIIS